MRALLCLISTVFVGGAAFAATSVRITTDDRRTLVGRTVIVLRKEGDTKYTQVSADTRIDARGTCEFMLEPGAYRFEVFDESTLNLLCVRSDEVHVVDRPVDVFLSTKQTTVKLADGETPLAITYVAVRSWAEKGELQRYFKNVDEIKLTTSSEGDVNLRIVGYIDDRVAVGWTKIKAGVEAIVDASASKWRRCEIEPHSGNPPLRKSIIHIGYPRGELFLPVNPKLTLLTNQPRVQLRYELTSKTGRSILSRNQMVDIEDGGRILLGGPLVPTAYAKIMTRLPKQKNLIHGAVLNDTAGREIHLTDSNIAWKSQVFIRGRPGVPANPLDENERGLIADPNETIAYRVSWQWTRQQSLDIRPTGFVKFRSKHYALFAPGGWSGRATNYLAILERTRTVLRENTGRKGPWKTVIFWRLNTHNAKAQVGGSNPWMSMPFQGLRSASKPIGSKTFMIHEMLHTFGYNHGTKMNVEEGRGRAALRRLQWRIPHELYEDDEPDYPIDRILKIADIPEDLQTFLVDSEEPQMVIEITSARFGGGKKWVDVTNVVKEKFASSSQMLTNSTRGLGVNVKGVKKKRLEVHYRLNGEAKSISIPGGKNQNVNLGAWLH